MAAAPNPSFMCPITQEVMTDPVIGSDGITYERSAIEEWFDAGHHTSPLTREPMSSRNLVPNYALKAVIEEAQRHPGGSTSQDRAASPSSTTNNHHGAGSGHAPHSPPPLITIKAGRLPGTHDSYHVSLSAPDTPDATIPTLFIDVLDISGSMGSSSVDTTHATSDAAAFSRADLVRHSVATQIELLRPQDKLALVLFDDKASVALQPTAMSSTGRTRAKQCLPMISPNGGTNIWTGLQRALQLANEAAAKNMNIVIILQTDGESDPSYNPPRGIVETFRSWLDKHPDTHVTVHTVGYGFGSALDMPLLRQIAEAGRGTVNYVPDGSMIGTVFIHLMSNCMSCLYRNLRLQVPEAGLYEDVGFLQGGQSRDFILTTSEPSFTVAVSDHTGVVVSRDVDAASCGDADRAESTFQKVRLDFITTLREALAAAEANDVDGAAAQLEALEARTVPCKEADGRIVSLLTDLRHAEKHKGQIGKAFDNLNAFQRWGRHYIPGVVCGHASQWAINFKDEGSKTYGGPTIKDLVIKGDDIFNSLPPPTASCAFSYSYSSYSSSSASSAPISMASVNSAAGPCFLGASLVHMACGTLKRCDEVLPGDMDERGNKVKCVVKTQVPYADVVRLGQRTNPEGGFTCWHPVLTGGSWQHPADVDGQVVERVKTDAVYNFVMEAGHLLTIDGVITCTLGHDFSGPVVGHPYFGKRDAGQRNIVDDLALSPGWSHGYVTWSDVRVERDDKSGLINRMIPYAATAVEEQEQ